MCWAKDWIWEGGWFPVYEPDLCTLELNNVKITVPYKSLIMNFGMNTLLLSKAIT